VGAIPINSPSIRFDLGVAGITFATEPGTTSDVDRAVTTDAEDPDDVLLAATARGDQRAFAALVERHADAIHRYVFRMTGSRADAEDFTQETLLRLWRKAGSYQPGRVKVSTWLHTIAHNLTVDALRRPHAVAEAAAGAAAEELDVAADSAGPFEAHAARETLQRLERALAALPARQRAALLLCQVQGFSNAEAADILGSRVRAVESLLARARRTLRQALSNEGYRP
jgi:RNA polymerase sigma-70 factor (ECF subfamily)